MKIRKAKKSDFEEYYKLKILDYEDYGKEIGKKIDIPSKSNIKKEFLNILNFKNIVLLVAEEKGELMAYTQGQFFNENDGFSTSRIHIGFLFVKEDYRKKGLGTKVIKELVKISKEKKMKTISLDVSPKNKGAYKLYKRLGFEINRYYMDKKIK